MISESIKTYSGRLIDDNCVKVTVERNIISKVEPISPDAGLPYLLPVLVDLQHNGGLGTYYNMLEKKGAQKLYEIADLLRRNGVGRCLATLTTHPFDKLLKSAELFTDTLSKDNDLEKLFFGFFQEGLFISPKEGWRGSHLPEYMIAPDWEKFSELDAKCGGRIKVVNVAPEEPGAMEFIEQAAKAGKLVSIGHCCPSTEVIKESVKRGVSLVTHFGNGAAPMIHRFKNPFWEMLNNDSLKLGLVCDGFHLPPELVELALKVKGKQNCYPVSDATGFSGGALGTHKFDDGTEVVVEDNGYIHVKDSEILSGAWFQLNRGVEFLIQNSGMSFVEAWKQCSLVPAEIIGIKLPAIKVGEEASFVIADYKNDKIEIKHSVHNGKEY